MDLGFNRRSVDCAVEEGAVIAGLVGLGVEDSLKIELENISDY